MRVMVLLGLLYLLSPNPGAVNMIENETDHTVALPDSIDGWKVHVKDQTYDRGNLYDYIDGGAELYLSFEFKTLINRTYSLPGQPDIVVDLFDMGSSKDAFGVFSLSRETVDETFGQGSQYTGGLLLFWKNNYFVSILASPETDESKKAVFALAKGIEAAIPGEGPLPDILSLLPQRLLVPESIRYFRHHIWLNSHYFVAAENILNINEKTDAVLAKYGELGKRSVLLLVEYQNDDEARLGYSSFVQHYLPQLAGKPVARIEDGTWTGCRLKGKLLIIVFNAAGEDTALHLIEEVLAEHGNR
ncbi:MAG: DUF6599 family protein [Candidatus Glassbacteria bacterium]